jgi:hypothetical protein
MSRRGYSFFGTVTTRHPGERLAGSGIARRTLHAAAGERRIDSSMGRWFDSGRKNL